jgi:aminodeoxyfutalosine synthase
MSTSAPFPFDHLMERVTAGERLTADDLSELAATPDLLSLGMLADTVRRSLHGSQVTYVRVALCPFDTSFTDVVPRAAREIRITGAPGTLDVAVAAVEMARAFAADRAVSGFSWADVERLAGAAGVSATNVLERLRSAGLDAIADLPLDHIDNPAEALDRLVTAGYRHVRLTIDKAPAAARTTLLLRAAELQEEFACIRTLSPLPSTLDAMRPTTGYDDVKTVAIARLAAPNIPTVQVDWLRYGPKLAQVALTFGADDVDNVTASDDAPDGRRRAPLEAVRRNIEAAGFEPAERDGRFALIG